MAILLPNQQTGSLDDVNEQVKIGLSMPLSNDVTDGYFGSTTTYLEASKQNLKNLLTTRKGERVMQPSIGTDLYKRVFEPITDTLEDEIKQDIINAIKTWLPFLSIRNIIVDISEGLEQNSIGIRIDFTMGTISGLESIQIDY